MTEQLSEEAGRATSSETDILREQELKACEIAYRALQENDGEVLQWFTVRILKRPHQWRWMVCLALWDKDQEGTLRWRTARKPLALLNLIAWHSAGKWEPHLRRLRPHRRREELMSDAIGGEGHYSESMDRFVHRRVGDQEYDELWDLDEDLVVDDIQIIHGQRGQFFRIGLVYSWQKIGDRMDWDADQIKLLKARALGITRSDMPRYLGWTENKCAAVWRKSSKDISQAGTKARARLLRHENSSSESPSESET